MTIFEKRVYVQCRKEDEDIVKGQLDAAIQGYTKIMKEASGVNISVDLKIDTQDYLPPV